MIRLFGAFPNTVTDMVSNNKGTLVMYVGVLARMKYDLQSGEEQATINTHNGTASLT